MPASLAEPRLSNPSECVISIRAVGLRVGKREKSGGVWSAVLQWPPAHFHRRVCYPHVRERERHECLTYHALKDADALSMARVSESCVGDTSACVCVCVLGSFSLTFA